MKVVWSPLAERRAIKAFEFMAQEQPQAAADWLRELLAHVETLDRFARRGRAVPEIGRTAYRQLLLHPYRVIYRVDATRVVILTIRPMRRDWDADDVSPGA